MTYWFTGLPCSGKTSICKEILKAVKHQIVHLDGDEMRKGLCSDLGFSDEDRKENIRRIAEVCKVLNDADMTVIASFVSPTDDIRQIYQEIVPNITTIYVECPLKLCKTRDVKGMYRKAYEGLIDNFTGMQAPYENPEADFVIKGYGNIKAEVHLLLAKISQRNWSL